MIALLVGAAFLASQDTVVLSLDAATARAVRRSPDVAAAEGAVREPRGLLAETRWPVPDNPILEFGRVRRQSTPGVVYDRQWSLSQSVEIGGQWLARGRGAAALVRAAEAMVSDARRHAALDARRAYAALATAERRVALSDSAALFAERLSDFATKQFAAGEFNRLERNVVVLEAARARSAADRARAQAVQAAADLGRLLGLPQDSTVRTLAMPEIPDLPSGADSVVLRRALAHALSRRPDLMASAAARDGAQRFAAAARRARVPNLAVSAFSGREAGTDNLFGVAVGLSIPLVYRQRANIGAADGQVSRAQSDHVAVERSILADVVAASARFIRAHAAERRFVGEVLRAANENVALTERALSEGEVGLTDVLVLRTTAVGAQLEYLEVLGEAWTAWFDLAAALAVDPAELMALLNAGA